jgi:hypothetical protein
MQLHRAEGFLYTKHPVHRIAPPVVSRAAVVADGEMFGYAYTARRLPRPTLAAVRKAVALKLVFGYAYTARYERMHDDRMHDDRIERTAA